MRMVAYDEQLRARVQGRLELGARNISNGPSDWGARRRPHVATQGSAEADPAESRPGNESRVLCSGCCDASRDSSVDVLKGEGVAGEVVRVNRARYEDKNRQSSD